MFNFYNVNIDNKNETVTFSTASKGAEVTMKDIVWNEHTFTKTLMEANDFLLDYFNILIKEFDIREGQEAIDRIKEISSYKDFKFFHNEISFIKEELGEDGEYYDTKVISHDKFTFIDESCKASIYFERVNNEMNITKDVILERLVNSLKLEDDYKSTDYNLFPTPIHELWIKGLDKIKKSLTKEKDFFIIKVLSKISFLERVEEYSDFLDYIRLKFNLGLDFKSSDLKKKLDNILEDGLKAIEENKDVFLNDNLELEILD